MSEGGDTDAKGLYPKEQVKTKKTVNSRRGKDLGRDRRL